MLPGVTFHSLCRHETSRGDTERHIVYYQFQLQLHLNNVVLNYNRTMSISNTITVDQIAAKRTTGDNRQREIINHLPMHAF